MSTSDAVFFTAILLLFAASFVLGHTCGFASGRRAQARLNLNRIYDIMARNQEKSE